VTTGLQRVVHCEAGVFWNRMLYSLYQTTRRRIPEDNRKPHMVMRLKSLDLRLIYTGQETGRDSMHLPLAPVYAVRV
jgi:hypothetical protein